jgi:hypothetical protein
MTGRILRVWETFQNYDLGESEAFQSGFFRLRTAQQCLGWTLVFQSLSPKENEGSRKPILFFRNCQVSLVFQTICLTFLKNIAVQSSMGSQQRMQGITRMRLGIVHHSLLKFHAGGLEAMGRAHPLASLGATKASTVFAVRWIFVWFVV